MITTTITPNIEESPWDDLRHACAKGMGRILRIGRLPKGTMGGKDTVSMHIRTVAGEDIVAEMTLEHLITAVQVMEQKRLIEFAEASLEHPLCREERVRAGLHVEGPCLECSSGPCSYKPVAPVGSGLTTDKHDPKLRETKDNGQKAAYFVLSEEDRRKGCQRPVRDTYQHTVCGTHTKMGRAIAETYAIDPKTYTHTFCLKCRDHLPVAEFTWEGTEEVVGS